MDLLCGRLEQGVVGRDQRRGRIDGRTASGDGAVSGVDRSGLGLLGPLGRCLCLLDGFLDLLFDSVRNGGAYGVVGDRLVLRAERHRITKPPGTGLVIRSVGRRGRPGLL